MKIEFPDNFKFGAATAAYQIEGATREDGRGEIHFDQLFKMPVIKSDPTIACDHYHRYKEDIGLMREIGLQTYRLSISWTRIFPEGDGKLNEKGLKFYDDLINELVYAGIEPLATLYHFDFPLSFYDIGGWRNQRAVSAFSEYAKICIERFGDRVKYWVTFNEPAVDQYSIYYMMEKMKSRKAKEVFPEVLNNLHGLFKAHALAIKSFRDLDIDGKIGIVLNLGPVYPISDSEKDIEAAKRYDDFLNIWHLNLSLKGEYPQEIFNNYWDTVNAPKVTGNDLDLLKENKSDFIGVNFYGPFFVRSSIKNFPLKYDIYKEKRSQEWANNAKVSPKDLYKILVRIDREYDSPIIYITENGCSFGDEQLNDEKDEWRIDYLKRHLREVKRAIDDGAKVERYYVWTLMDNLEWAQGFEEKYGLIYVDFAGDLKRTIKKSGRWYSEVIKNRGFEL
jgi:beta-glucosidase